jgi:hypothetical protein
MNVQSEVSKRVRVISYTQPTEELKKEGLTNLQELVAYSARVSNPTSVYVSLVVFVNKYF